MEHIKIISHRGNVFGPDLSRENTVRSVIECIDKYNLDVEIDVRVDDNNNIILGHDEPGTSRHTLTEFNEMFLKYESRLWVHCKNIQSLIFFVKQTKYNSFGHDNDEFVLTSKGYIFTRPGILNTDTITVMPELVFKEIPNNLTSQGILTDYPLDYRCIYANIS